MSSILEKLLAVATCNSEEDQEKLEQLLDPTTRTEMGPVYEEAIGYNPITYFDRRDTEKYFNSMIEDAPQSIKEVLEEKKEEIIESVLEHKENLNEEYLITLLNLSFEKECGWRNKKYHAVNLEEEFVSFEELDEDDDDDFENDDEYESDYEEEEELDEELDLTEDDE